MIVRNSGLFEAMKALRVRYFTISIPDTYRTVYNDSEYALDVLDSPVKKTFLAILIV